MANLTICDLCNKGIEHADDLHKIEVDFENNGETLTQKIKLCSECLFPMINDEEVAPEVAEIAEETYGKLTDNPTVPVGMAHHLNVNVLNQDLLRDAMENPDRYPQLCIRVSGYCVNFNRLSKEQQEEVISRTFHESI